MYKEKKVFALVGYKRNTENNARIRVDLCLRNSSETLLSEIKIQLFDNDSKQWVDNQYKNPVREFIDTTVKNKVQETYNDIMEQHYNELFCDEYSNIQPAEDFVINLDMSNKHIEYPVENLIKSGYTPEALFFKIKIVSRSIYDELFEQEIELGLRLFAGMKGVKPNKYNRQTYDSWQIYEVLKIKTKAICTI